MSEATPSGYEMGVKAAGTLAGVQDFMSSCRPVVLSLKRSSTIGYWLQMRPASSRSKSAIHSREEYKNCWHYGRGARIVGRVVVRWSGQSRLSVTG
ncbi:MAG: hypothetical protein NT172_07540 [Planctomycetota bacterium]|nr:hypothetical protein [Planctomycetota bacterium]